MKSDRPRRSLLFVPGDSRRMIEKAATLAVDSIILDLEDGVTLERKNVAEEVVVDALKTIDFGGRERIVRLDADRERADLEVDDIAHLRPDAFLVPKVETLHNLKRVGMVLSEVEHELKLPNGTFRLWAMIETALGLMNLGDICKAPSRLDALIFGGEDYVASVGGQRTREGSEVLYARSMVVAAAAAYELDAIDCVYVDYQDAEGFAADCRLGRQLGFVGKTIIHPAQVDACNEHFTPSRDEVAWAQEVVDGMERAQREGKGAITVRGAMVDKPVLRSARQILRRAVVG